MILKLIYEYLEAKKTEKSGYNYFFEYRVKFQDIVITGRVIVTATPYDPLTPNKVFAEILKDMRRKVHSQEELKKEA